MPRRKDRQAPDEGVDRDHSRAASRMSLEYAETGPRAAPVILLIMGLGMQLVASLLQFFPRGGRDDRRRVPRLQ